MIELVKRMSEAVAAVTVNGTAREVWVRSKARKAGRCCLCRRSIVNGNLSWRTTGNGLHRADRVCGVCW